MDRQTGYGGTDDRTDGQVIMEWTDRQVMIGRTIRTDGQTGHIGTAIGQTDRQVILGQQ